MKEIAYKKTVPNKVAGNFMNLLCETHIRYKSGLTLFEHASNSFSDVYGTFLDDVSIGKNIKVFLIYVDMLLNQ